MITQLKSAVGVAVLLASVLSASSSLAWGTDGHQVVALIAQSKLTEKARAEVNRLLVLEPGQTLASISTWADEHRNPATAAWHYVNFPRATCHYESERDCPDGKCVVGAIERQIDVLKSNADDTTKLGALKYVVHFVADVHQPLHAGYADDRGGNQFQLQAFMRGTNLHALWDKEIIKNLNLSPEVIAKRLSTRSFSFPTIEFSPSISAEESCKIVGSEGYYPGRQVGQEYIDKFTPIAEQRLGTAGARLSGILNALFK